VLDDCGPIWSMAYRHYYHDSVLRLGRLLVITVRVGHNRSCYIAPMSDVSDSTDTYNLCNWMNVVRIREIV